MAVCRYHPDRPGVGVCMRCRAVICTACSTRVDGVNHCHACLRALGTRQEVHSGDFATAFLGAVAFAASIALFFVLSWFVQGWMAP